VEGVYIDLILLEDDFGWDLKSDSCSAESALVGAWCVNSSVEG